MLQPTSLKLLQMAQHNGPAFFVSATGCRLGARETDAGFGGMGAGGAAADKQEKDVVLSKFAGEAWHGQEWSKKRLGKRELHIGSTAGLHEQQRCSSRFHCPNSPSKCFL